MRMSDAINSPGKGQGTGDDRYGFDEAAGTAWVIDGATDVGQVRLFPDFESDAAWLADAVSTRLMTPPRALQSAEDYFAAVATDVAARLIAESAYDVSNAPRDSWPTASFLWLRMAGGAVETVRFGDCVALMRGEDYAVTVFADEERPEAEVERARAHQNSTWEEKLPYLQAERTAYNSPGMFVEPDAEPALAKHVVTTRAPIPRGASILVMSDGLYRLVSPFRHMDHDTLLNMAEDDGLAAAVTRLRELERGPDGPARFKASDDATGLLLFVD